MEISKSLLCRIESDLCLNQPFIKGQINSVKRCWHFWTNGNDVDAMFFDETGFRDGMNRVYVISLRYDIIILAFVLMDTHVHFILYGDYQSCSGFIHEYINATSKYISIVNHQTNKLANISIRHQAIQDEMYLKTLICYVIKNPTSGGLPFMSQNYPWSSGSLYFSERSFWSAPSWVEKIPDCPLVKDLSILETRKLFHTRNRIETKARIIDGIIFPGDYVAYTIVQMLFRSAKSFHYFLSLNKDSEIESNGGVISELTLPLQELRQHKNELCMELFGKTSLKNLSTSDRIMLAKKLKSKYNSSTKQIARVCGLNYEDAGKII